MRKLALASLAVLSLGAVIGWVPVPAALAKGFEALAKAPSLNVEYTLRKGDGAPAAYKLLLGKPNAFRWTTPTGYVVSDGKTVTTYTEAAKSYSETPLTDAWLAEFARRPEIMPWAAFFQKAPADEYLSVAATVPRKIGGVDTDAVSFEPKKGLGGTLYLDRQSGVARAATLGPSREPTLVVATKLEVGKVPPPTDPGPFAFVPPAGAVKTVPVVTVAFADVKAMIDDRCLPCHAGATPKAGIKLDTYEGIVATVVPGDPKASLLIKSVKGEGVRKMPLGNHPALTEAEIAAWSAWIEAGAKKA